MKRSQFNSLCSLFVACALLVCPVTLGCGGGDAEMGGDVATDGMGDDAGPMPMREAPHRGKPNRLIASPPMTGRKRTERSIRLSRYREGTTPPESRRGSHELLPEPDSGKSFL